MSARVIAIVQARMKSSRLPGKVLQDIAGRPLLWHVLHRLGKCKTLTGIVIATSTDPADDAIAAYCADTGVQCVRGPEDNVLKRFVMAAQASHADVILRVTADAPLIDAAFMDYLVSGLINCDADFVMMRDNVAVAHEGADPFTRRALDKLALEAAHDPVAREHVSAYFKEHPNFVRIARLDAPKEYRFKCARLSVDTPADAMFIEAVYTKLNANAGEASLTDLIALLRRDPELLSINAHVVQKAPTQIAGTILIRCDGGGSLGLGHIKRGLALARQLRDVHGYGVGFAMAHHETACALVAAQGFAVHPQPKNDSETGWLISLMAWVNPCAVIFDTRTINGADAVHAVRDAGFVTAVIDDSSARRLHADFAFYPPVPQARELDWTGARTQRMTGWEWTILGAAPVTVKTRAAGAAKNILVTMGGSDPKAQTLVAARACLAVLGTHRVTVAIGPDVADSAQVLQSLRQLPGPVAIVQGADDLRPLMAECDLAISMFGVTAYELAAHGVPALYLSLTPDHARSAQAFVDAGIGTHIGPAGIGQHMIEAALHDLINDDVRLTSMRHAGLASIDGRGAERIAAVIVDRVNANRQSNTLRMAG